MTYVCEERGQSWKVREKCLLVVLGRNRSSTLPCRHLRHVFIKTFFGRLEPLFWASKSKGNGIGGERRPIRGNWEGVRGQSMLPGKMETKRGRE